MTVRLVVAPHLDDEVLGVGGSLARWAREGQPAQVAVVTRGTAPLYSQAEEDRCRREGLAAHQILGVAGTRFLDLPAAELDTVAQRLVNQALLEALRDCAPDELYLPFPGDLHRDHQLVFQAALVAARPNRSGYPKAIYAYETLSETNWNAAGLTPAFQPDHFIDITADLGTKLAAMAQFRSQLRSAPHERSLDSLRALALLRGACVHLGAAEAFVTIRTVT